MPLAKIPWARIGNACPWNALRSDILNERIIAKALTDADYSPKVGFSAATGCVSSLRK
jgi:hypothetical protein